MTTNSRNVAVGAPRIGGAIFRAPLDTALPTDEATALNAGFISQGYAGADGLQRAIAKAYEILRAWGGDEVHRPRTELSITLSFTLIESYSGEVAKTIWGEDAITITPATASAGTKIALAYKGEELGPSEWVIDMQDGDKVRRIVLPHGQIVTESFEQTFGDAELIAYPVELTLRKDESGVFFYEYTDDGIKSA